VRGRSRVRVAVGPSIVPAVAGGQDGHRERRRISPSRSRRARDAVNVYRPPLRDHAWQLVGVALGLAVGLGIVVLGWSLAGGDRYIPAWVLLVLVAVVLVVGLGASVTGVLIGRRVYAGHLELALREPGRRWRHGRIVVDPAGARFEHYLWQLRVPDGEWSALPGARIVADAGRRTGMGSLLSVNPFLHIVELETETGRFEVAATSSGVTELRRRLASA